MPDERPTIEAQELADQLSVVTDYAKKLEARLEQQRHLGEVEGDEAARAAQQGAAERAREKGEPQLLGQQ